MMASVVDQDAVLSAAQEFCDALAAGDIEGAMGAFSPELRRNAGEVLAMLPLPATKVEIESLERSGAGYNVVLRLGGETNEDLVQTRWKDRDGRPTVVEASHLSRTEREATAEELAEEEAARTPGAVTTG